MKIVSRQIKGKGRGKFLGFPTINLEIPDGFEFENGIYSGMATIESKDYLAAIHFGPVPTFNEQEKSLEIFLIDISDLNLPKSPIDNLELTIKNKLRDIRKFKTEDLLKKQIQKDVENIRAAHAREIK